MDIKRIFAAAPLLALPTIVYAGAIEPTLPEPETLALLGVGAIAMIVARWRRKK